MKNKKSIIINEDEVGIKKRIGEKIKSLRRRNGLSAETLANGIGMSRVSLTQIEGGRNNVSAVTLWKLACRLKCEIKDFFPPVVKEYGLSKVDLSNIANEDKEAVDWAKNLFQPKLK